MQKQLARMSYGMRAVDVQKVFGWNGAQPGLKNRNMLSYKRIENAHKVQKKLLFL